MYNTDVTGSRNVCDLCYENYTVWDDSELPEPANECPEPGM